jgi:endoglucanase
MKSIAIKHGTNISHWLSQSSRRGAERRSFFTRDDVRRISDWGFDHIRLPIDEEQMWDERGAPDQEAFDLMDSAIDWSAQAGLNVVVDLHILRSHYFNAKTEPALFTDPAEGEKFAGLWHQLSCHLEKRPLDHVAYELMNEPVAVKADDWNRVAGLAFRAIRKREQNRFIVLGSNRWNAAATFDELAVPADPRTILSFHFYSPMLITHYKAPWWAEGALYNGPVQYPGRPIPDSELYRLSDEVRGTLAPLNQFYDRKTMVVDLAKPLAVAARTGLPLYCGEFGVIHLTPQPVRLAWYRDLASVFKDYGIGWANWDYKGGFGLIQDGQSTGIAETLLDV